MHDSSDCRFCQLANGTIETFVVYGDDLVTAFLDKDPISEGHTLIVPKRAYLDVDELDAETAARIMTVSMLISASLKELYHPDGISIMQNGGVFNDVGHYHMHVFCRFAGDGFGWTFGPCNPAQSYTAEVRQRLKNAIAGRGRG
jgi:histidine triad (HIT) family protein